MEAGILFVFDFTGFSSNFGVGIVYQPVFVGVVVLTIDEVVPSDQRQEAVEQSVEISLDNTNWGFVFTRPLVKHLALSEQGLPLDELNLEL
ncbi:MAG: hypothetical protein ACI9HK_005642 [Pirellulaceae bacterium]